MMLKRFAALLVVCFLTTAVAFSGAAVVGYRSPAQHLPLDQLQGAHPKTPENSHYLPNAIIIRMKDAPLSMSKGTVTSAALQSYLQRYSPSSVRQIFPEEAAASRPMNMAKFVTMTYSAPMDPFKVAAEVAKQSDVLYAEPWYIYEVSGCTPNDSARAQQWSLTKILADSAFCVQAGDSNVVIGIVDTGVEWEHPDLAANIWNNPGETGLDGLGRDKRTNGVDDDGDGFIDDWHGWDFGGADYRVQPSAGDNNPSPTNSGAGHGTHVAGIAAARTNNTIGVSGSSNNCRILPVKTGFDNDARGPGGTPYIVYGFEGVYYAAKMGAKVINLSWGGGGASQFEQEVIDSATALGALVVAAAGNANSEEPNYPASYRHVLSVCASTVGDSKASYSQWGENVDVMAPGGDGSTSAQWILSTWYPGTYAYLTGTSMATPLVSGVAALVKAHNPSLTPDQLGEQVRTTCDNITTSSTYKYKLGRGRINEYNALTKQLPALRLNSFAIRDSILGNNNGAIEPGEQFALITDFTNYLTATSAAATITLATFDSYVQITQNTYAIGAVATMGSASNAASPFVVKVNSNVPPGHIAQFVLLMSDGAYTDFQLISVLMYPTFATHDVNNVKVTFTNNGRIGFNDFDKNSQGVGFTYHGENHLFEGGVIVGKSATTVADAVRNENGTQDNDFTAITPIYSMVKPGPLAPQEGSAQYHDAGAATQMGITISQRSFEFTQPPDTNYVIVRYAILNTSGADISNLYMGLFMDYDMLPDYSKNKSGFDGTRSLGYAWDADTADTKTPVYCGVRALDTAAGFRGLLNSQSIDLSKAAKFGWLSGGIQTNDTLGDIHFAISEGPFSIPNGQSVKVGFALIAGNSLADLQRNADFARARWDNLKLVDAVGEDRSGAKPAVFALEQNYPNPFNPSTTIRYELAQGGMVTLTVYNTLGQQVQQLVNRVQPAGRYSAAFDASSLPSGMYLYRISVVGENGGTRFTEARKLLLVR